MHQSSDILILYDVPSSHAQAYRTMSFLLKKSTSRFVTTKSKNQISPDKGQDASGQGYPYRLRNPFPTRTQTHRTMGHLIEKTTCRFVSAKTEAIFCDKKQKSFFCDKKLKPKKTFSGRKKPEREYKRASFWSKLRAAQAKKNERRFGYGTANICNSEK